MEQNEVHPVTIQFVQYLELNYKPAEDYLHADLRMNTRELFEQLKPMFPIPDFTEEFLFNTLNDLGYRFNDSASLHPEWLFCLVNK